VINSIVLKENSMHYELKLITICAVLSITLICPVTRAGGLANGEILVQDNSTFAIDIYQKLRESGGNIFFSPYSISTALAMAYAGARGNTGRQMAKALGFSLDQHNLHCAFEVLESRLNELQKSGNVNLSVANSLWPQHDYKFLDEYLSLIKKHYGVLITSVDYKHAREAARKMINEWVEKKTQDKIKDLIQPGILDALTRLVLVNAVYFKGTWEAQFNTSQTKDAPFYISPEKFIRTPLMTQKQEFKYAKSDTLQILELPYKGGELSMIVLLPNESDGLERLESSLTLENLQRWKSRLRKREVIVYIF
jgi:serpin B